MNNNETIDKKYLRRNNYKLKLNNIEKYNDYTPSLLSKSIYINNNDININVYVIVLDKIIKKYPINKTNINTDYNYEHITINKLTNNIGFILNNNIYKYLKE